MLFLRDDTDTQFAACIQEERLCRSKTREARKIDMLRITYEMNK
ncbi:MAG: hypothetical protein QOF74_3095 [Caballeronia mineralivorans]|nr:hypothetical protein [Caballeronia mineralivorans]